MLSLIIIGSLITAVGFISIMAKSSPKFLKLMLGYEALVDLCLSILISIYVAFSGTISGIIIGAMAGVFMSLALFIGARTIGYSKLEKTDGKYKIVDFPAKWNYEYFKGIWNSFAAKYSRA